MRVCLICEGSYPYVSGGVSNWVQMLCNEEKIKGDLYIIKNGKKELIDNDVYSNIQSNGNKLIYFKNFTVKGKAGTQPLNIGNGECMFLADNMEFTGEYDDINEAIRNCNVTSMGIRIIGNKHYQTGYIRKMLSECKGDTVLDINVLEIV